MAEPVSIKNHAAFIWSVADLLRGDYKQSEYGRVILPLTVLRRLDCVLEPTKAKVLEQAAKYGDRPGADQILRKAAGEQFYNTSKHDFPTLLAAPDDLADNLRHYIASFSPGARDVIDKFGFDSQITRLAKANLLYLVVSKFAEIDLHPTAVSNLEMGYLYEELIRKFSELSNETAGEHFTPREVIRLMVNLLFIEDGDLLTKPGISKTLLDPACGTGGMLSVAEDYLREHNPSARLHVYGQELNAETYAICRSDMMLKGQDATNIAFGNSFTDDGHRGGHFDYLLANPPFGVEWKKVADRIRDEHDKQGFGGRFGAGLPRINDGSFLFLQHMIAKIKPAAQGGSRLAIVFNDQLGVAEEMALAYVDNPDMQAEVVATYLPFVQGRAKVLHQEHCNIVELLGPDKESTHLEYKATLRTHADGGEVFKPLETASLKTIAAFLNSREGGTLIIGVGDDGTVHGLASDYATRSKKDQDPRDWFQQHLANIVSASMGDAAATLVRPHVHQVDGGDVCRVQVDPAGFPVDAKVIIQKPGGPKETRTEFYVRVANGTKALDTVERRSTSPSGGGREVRADAEPKCHRIRGEAPVGSGRVRAVRTAATTLDAGWDVAGLRSRGVATLVTLSDAARRHERDLSAGDGARVEEAHRALRDAVAVYERFHDGPLDPGEPAPVHDAGEMRAAQEAIEAAEDRLWQLREKLLSLARPSWAPSAALTSDWFSEEDSVYDDVPETSDS